MFLLKIWKKSRWFKPKKLRPFLNQQHIALRNNQILIRDFIYFIKTWRNSKHRSLLSFPKIRDNAQQPSNISQLRSEKATRNNNPNQKNFPSAFIIRSTLLFIFSFFIHIIFVVHRRRMNDWLFLCHGPGRCFVV